jgi:hypothetical protein
MHSRGTIREHRRAWQYFGKGSRNSDGRSATFELRSGLPGRYRSNASICGRIGWLGAGCHCRQLHPRPCGTKTGNPHYSDRLSIVIDPAGQSFVASLGRPGGNITGFSFVEFPMLGKWLEIA